MQIPTKSQQWPCSFSISVRTRSTSPYSDSLNAVRVTAFIPGIRRGEDLYLLSIIPAGASDSSHLLLLVDVYAYLHMPVSYADISTQMYIHVCGNISVRHRLAQVGISRAYPDFMVCCATSSHYLVHPETPGWQTSGSITRCALYPWSADTSRYCFHICRKGISWGHVCYQTKHN